MVTCVEALADPYQQRPIGHRAVALGPIEPLIEPTSGHAECLAHPSHRPDAAVTYHEGVLHWDSFAKYASAFFNVSRSAVTFISSRFKRNSSACSGLIFPLPGKGLSGS